MHKSPDSDIHVKQDLRVANSYMNKNTHLNMK